MSLKEKIICELEKENFLSDRELTDRIFGRNKPQQSINQACRQLEKIGQLKRTATPIKNYIQVNFTECNFNEEEKIQKEIKKCRKNSKILISINKLVDRLNMNNTNDQINIFDYKFNFIQNLVPILKSNGSVDEYFPQERYVNINNLPLHKHGDGPFCKFNINFSNNAGIYLWVVDDEIIYIGETNNFNRRFNQGYGNISARNCYKRGQSTNCKMNKVVLDYFKRGKKIKLYCLVTNDYKAIELKLLQNITTIYNVKDN